MLALEMRGWFSVDEPRGERWELALELLQRGEAVAIGDIGLQIDGSAVTAIATSAWADPSNITPDSARNDFGRARRVLESLIEADPTVRSLAETRRLRLELICDYETGSILVASMCDNGELVWHYQR